MIIIVKSSFLKINRKRILLYALMKNKSENVHSNSKVIMSQFFFKREILIIKLQCDIILCSHSVKEEQI